MNAPQAKRQRFQFTQIALKTLLSNKTTKEGRKKLQALFLSLLFMIKTSFFGSYVRLWAPEPPILTSLKP
jgi:hypothetical protein